MNKLVIMLPIALIAVIGLFIALRPKQQPQPATQPQQSTPTPVVEPPPAPPVDEFVFTVQGGQVSRPASFKTTEGREVIIRVTADVSDEVHLHGYDYSKEIEAGNTVELRFTADRAGRFELELEQRKLTLGFLEVQPQ